MPAWLYNEAVNAEPRGPLRRTRNLGPEIESVGRQREMGRWDLVPYVRGRRVRRDTASAAMKGRILPHGENEKEDSQGNDV